MSNLFSKIKVALGLYDVRTLMSKFNELFLINPKRYSDNISGAVPEFSSANDIRVPFLLGDREETYQPKIIYYLIHCFYPDSQGGTERFVYNLAKKAKNHGHRVKIITYNVNKPRGHFRDQISGILFNEYTIDGLEVVEYRHKRASLGILKDVILDDPEVMRFAEFLFEKEKPDILHAAYIQKVSSFIAACRKHGIPYGITLTSFFSLCHYDTLIDRTGCYCSGSVKGFRCQKSCACLDVKDASKRYQQMHQLLSEAAFLAAPSVFVKKTIKREYANLNIHIINHGVSREFLLDQENIPFIKKSPRNFAYFGSLTPIKGIRGLITAFRELPADCSLNIYGSGPEFYVKKLKRLADGQENIFFHGSVHYNQINQAYKANDVVVVPSIWYETYNFVIHEALLMNRTVIASRIGAIPERIRDGINGFTFNPGDWKQLAIIMQQILRDNWELPPGHREHINSIEAEYQLYNQLYESAL